MANGDDLPLSLEIPWQLAATTQPLAAGEPDETSISLFYFEPDDETFAAEFPDERLIFLKFTVLDLAGRVSARHPAGGRRALGEGMPCFHVLLDLKVRDAAGAARHRSGRTSTPRRRSRRQMVQTGVVGAESYRGRVRRPVHRQERQPDVRVVRAAIRAPPRSAPAPRSASARSPSAARRAAPRPTIVTRQRAVSQVVDTTTREASQERRELVSHITQVENVLTLLNAKYVGTPHLSFSLSPQPLQLLSVDPSDPNLWFSQLLARRSSGIEGIQEFTAVVLVPRDEDFCVNARLRRVCVLDDPPGPLTFDERFIFNQHQWPAAQLPRSRLPGRHAARGVRRRPHRRASTRRTRSRGRSSSCGSSAAAGPMLVDVVSPTPQPFVRSVRRATVELQALLELWLETLARRIRARGWRARRSSAACCWARTVFSTPASPSPTAAARGEQQHGVGERRSSGSRSIRATSTSAGSPTPRSSARRSVRERGLRGRDPLEPAREAARDAARQPPRQPRDKPVQARRSARRSTC